MASDHPGSERRPPGCADTVARCFFFAVLFVVAAIIISPFLGPCNGPHVRLRQTESMIQRLSLALDFYRERSGTSVPDDATGLHPDLDKPAECLVYYLSGKSIYYNPATSPPDYPWRHEALDTSRLGKGRKNATAFYEFRATRLADTDNDGLPEVVDPWGKPLLYNTGPAEDGPFNQNGAPKHNPGKFDLSSAGPDGEHDTEDDITSWE